MYLLKNKNIFFALLTVFAFGYILRLTGSSANDIIHQHISNFAITGSLYLIMASDIILKKGFTRGRLILLATPFALLNIIIELFIKNDKFTFLGVTFINFNTPDPIDMVFGLLSLLISITVILYFSSKKTSLG